MVLAAAACSRPDVGEGLRVRLLVDPEVVASCLSVELADLDGKRLDDLRLERQPDKGEYLVAVLRGAFPAEVAFSAAALVGTACESPLLPNGRSDVVRQTFSSAEVREVVLRLAAPGQADDADHDGYRATARGGNDCADDDPTVHPGAPEDCAGGIDRNCDGHLGCADSTCAGQACADAPAALAFTTLPLTLPAAACSPLVGLQIRDAAGTPSKVRANTTLGLEATAPGEVRFYADGTCTQRITEVVVAAHETTTTFHFRGAAPGSARLNASSSALTTASQDETLTAALPAALVFATPAQAVTAGVCSAESRVQTRDALGQVATAQAPLSLTLAAAPATGFTLYAGPGCTNPTSALTVSAGSDTAGFFFQGTRAGPVLLTVSGLGTAAQEEAVTPAHPSALVFTTPEQTLDAGTCSAPVTLQTRDPYGNPSPVPSALRVPLTAAPDAGFVFFSDPVCSVQVNAAAFGAGYDTRTFRFKASEQGEFVITAAAADAGLTSATQHESVHLPWPAAFSWRRPITVTPGPSSPTGGYAGYTLTVTFDTAGLVALGKLRADGEDLRVFFWDGGGWSELDREVSGLNTAATTVRFQCKTDVAPSAANTSHFLYYGDPIAGAAPANRDNVYLFWDDFESGTLDKWTVRSGLWQAATDRPHAGASSLKYSTETQQGDKWLVANPPLDEADVLFEAWWNLSSVANADVAQFLRQQPNTTLNEYETNLVNTGGWNLSREVAGGWTRVSANTGTPAANTWMRLGLAIHGTRMRLFKDGAQVSPSSGTTDMGSNFASGSVGFRKWSLPNSGQTWWVDDVTVRRYTDPEPTTAVGAEEAR